MVDINNMSKLFDILENLIWSFLGYKIYTIYLFTNLSDSIDTFASLKILVISIAVSVIVGIMLTIKHRRNSLSTAINVSLPLAVYSMIAYFRYVGLLIVILLALSILLSVFYIVMTRQYSKSNACKKNKKFCIKRYSFLGVRTITTMVCSFLIVVLLGSSLTGFQLYRPTQNALTDTSVDYSEYLNKNIDSIMLLDSGWEKLDNEQKMNVLQKVCNIERAKLGINNPIHVKSKAYMNDLLACYNPKDYSVSINAHHLDDNGMDVLESCLHECHHAYQFELVDLYNNISEEKKQLAVFTSVKSYKEELSNYKCGEDFDEYYQQKCEMDARSYALYEVQSYKNVINDYKKKG